VARVKGTALLSSYRYVRERFGAAASCEYGLTGVYKVFFKVGSPEWIISKGAQVYSRYCDTGELKIVEVVSGRAVVELVGFEGGSRKFCERWLDAAHARAGRRG
jgi:hypothetical protein